MEASENHVSVFKVGTDNKPVIANLIQLYLYNMTGELPFPIRRDGRFEYGLLECFWQHPLIFEGEDLAGFALVIDGSPVSSAPDRHFMAEFFVLRAYLGKGTGISAFSQILRIHTGPWQIGVIDKNVEVNAFWAKVTAPNKPATPPHRFDGENWLLYEFGLLP
jgi:predicted acetyltransferase